MDDATLEVRLRELSDDPDKVVLHSYALVTDLAKSGIGLSAVRMILKFMEENPDLDFGAPGPLAHFIEEFPHNEYVDELLASLARRPTALTVFLLNRVINGTEDRLESRRLVHALEQAGRHEAADEFTRESVSFFLQHHATDGQ